MRFLKLIWRNAVRSRRRAVLTILSIGVAIVAVSVLNSIIYAFNAGVEVADDARLVVRNANSLVFPLPLAYREKISAIPGVREAAWANWFGGVYQDKKQFFAKFAVDAESYFKMYPEYAIPPEEFQAFLADRRGCLVGRKVAEKYGFRIGQTIPIQGDIYPGSWEFNVHGIYHGTRKGADETMMFFHWKYVDESLPPRRQGDVGFYIVQVEQPDQAGQVAKDIDAYFENSPRQTLTETEKAFQLGFVKMMGNIELLVRVIGLAVVFTLLLVAGNTMALAALERTTEIAILKAIGFKKGLLAALVLGESLLLNFLGWLAGTGAAWGVCRWVEKVFPTIFPFFPLKLETVGLSLVVALFTGAVAGLFPALLAARTTVVDSLRKVA